MNLDTLAKRLKYLRKHRGFTQEELARMVDTTQDVIQKIENGKSLRPRNIEKLATALDTSPAWLQFGISELDKLDEKSIGLAMLFAELPPEQQKVIEATIKSLLSNK